MKELVLYTSRLSVLMSALMVVFGSQAQTVDIEQRQREQLEQQRAQQQQEQEQRASQLTGVSPSEAKPSQVSDSQQCFEVKHIQWQETGKVSVPNYLKNQAQQYILDDYGRFRCLNSAQIITLQKQLANSLIENGHITSKISFPSQNIASGTLNIDWYPGTVEQITHDTKQGQPIGVLEFLYPHQVGRLYNQRHFDQALENLKRLGSQGNASIDLVPGQIEGTTQVLYHLENTPWYKRIHGSAGLDNSGSDSSGQYQGNASLTFDSPLHLYDQLTVNFNHNADANSNQHNSKSWAAYWDVNHGPLNVSLSYSKSDYFLTSPGLKNPYVTLPDVINSGQTQDYSLGLSYMLYRNTSTKLQATGKIGRKITHNYIDHTEIPNQLRDYVYLDTGLNLTHYYQNQQYTLSANLRQNLPQHSKAVGEVLGQPNWDGKWRVYTVNAGATIPFQIQQKAFKYSSNLKLQHGERPLPGSEYFSIGSRYSVRGFDETFSLSAEDGLTWRNELAYLYGANKAQQIYLALDYGKVHGPATEWLAGTYLAGAALGARGSWRGLNYDVAIATPIHYPKPMSSKSPSIYASLNYSF